MSFKEYFKGISLTRFLEEITIGNQTDGFVCAIKRLSGNDTGLTKSHQVGLYLPKEFFRCAIPEICTTEKFNPDMEIAECYIASHDVELPTQLRAIYYNSKVCTANNKQKGTRNEFRITRWGGKNNPLQDETNTGCLVIFALAKHKSAYKAVAWLSESDEDDDYIEDWIGASIAGNAIVVKDRQRLIPTENTLPEIPEEWIKSAHYPSPKEIFSYVEDMLPYTSVSSIDNLLLARRKLEFSIFQALENEKLLFRIKRGFSSVEDFTNEAKSFLNRRKSRSGASLELHLSSIFTSCQIKFERNVVTEGRKKPDFIFPSGEAYHNTLFPISKLTFLAAKTCCKDRWRQILTEADRFRDQRKFLFTLQEGISTQQLCEMERELVSLVVPTPNIPTFSPPSPESGLFDLTTFVDIVRKQQQ